MAHSDSGNGAARFIQKWLNHVKTAKEKLAQVEADPAKYDLVKALDTVSHVVTLLNEVQKDAIAEILLRHRRPELVGQR